MQDVRRRAVIAGVVGLLGAFLGIAGAGHAYLRRWRRALAWFAIVLGVAIFLVAAFVDPAATENASSVWDVQMPLTVTVPMLVVQVLSALDAYMVARGQGAPTAAVGTGESAGTVTGDAAAGETVTCPNCGRDVDPDLDFCHWCTQRLDRSPEGVEPSRE